MTNGLMYTNLNGDGGGRLYFVNPVTIQEKSHRPRAAGSALYHTSGAVGTRFPGRAATGFSGPGSAPIPHQPAGEHLSDDLKAWG